MRLLLPAPPLRPTLFPYTTLFRSRQCDRRACHLANGNTEGCTIGFRVWAPRQIQNACVGSSSRTGADTRKRSEEHTSELHSLRHLVCRLLLEKKKQENNST